MNNSTFTFIFFFTILLSSCYQDSGPIIQEEIPVAHFDRLEIKADVDVLLFQDNWLGVVAEGPAESLSNLEFVVRNGELTIKDLGRISRNTIIRIHVPDLLRIEHDCHRDVYGQNFFRINGKIEIISTRKGNIDLAILADEIEVRHRGRGEIKIEGETDFLDLKVKDKGDFLGFDLYSKEARVKISNNGDAEINVDYELRATINGDGNIFLLGFPDIEINGNGDGEVIDSN